MKVYNTFSRTKEEFKPIVENQVSMYVCGPTVYGPPHLGHAKSYLNFDTVFRFFKFLNYKVKYVQNITDVGHLVGDGDNGEDKIAKQAKQESLDAYEIAYKYEVEYFKQLDKLNVLRPSISPRATSHVYEMIELVKKIIDLGYGYVTKEGNVYFNVAKHKNYGVLSNRKLDNNLSGERVELASDKINPEDFALWKSVSNNALMKWDSPWGVGCPGWHLECTVIAEKFLGSRFDIHGGGIDNLFPHHECECAQSEVVLGHRAMNYFMHNGLVTVNGTKMGKSLNNFITLEDLFKKHNPMVIRYYIMQFHYRSNVDFNDSQIDVAKKQLEKLTETYSKSQSFTKEVCEISDKEVNEIYNNFVDAMKDDFNTALAMAELNKINKLQITKQNAPQVNHMFEKLVKDVLGLELKIEQVIEAKVPQNVIDLAEQRVQAKKEKNFELSDKLRGQIDELGFVVKDTREGYELNKK